MNKNKFLALLPAFKNEAKLIAGDQSVSDIIDEVLSAHQVFAPDYDRIASDFDEPEITETCSELFDFCKAHIAYKIESEENQTTRSPSAIIALGDTIGGDCKHYAGFIGGCLDALRRAGKKINWWYRFASYKTDEREPQHVFVCVKDKGKEIWIDPVLDSFNEHEPAPDWIIDIKPRDNMALHRLSGLNDGSDRVGLLYLPADAGGAPVTLVQQPASDPALSEAFAPGTKAAAMLVPNNNCTNCGGDTVLKSAPQVLTTPAMIAPGAATQPPATLIDWIKTNPWLALLIGGTLGYAIFHKPKQKRK